VKFPRRQFLQLTGGAAALPMLWRVARAQNYPTRPMTMIVPFAPGGGQDVIGRVVAQRMSEVLGQQIVVENMGGAGGITASRRVADASPDGYTMGIGSVGTHAHHATLYKRPRYDPTVDFAPVALLAETPVVLITRKDLPASNLPEFITYARANQATMQFGSPGAGASSHIACVVLNHTIGVEATHVPYRGGTPAMQDLVGGRIDYQRTEIVGAKAQIEGGSVKAMAILTRERLAVMPNLPTAREQGLDIEAYAWTALFLPRRTPDAIVTALNRAVVDALRTPAVRERIAELGSVAVSDERATPQYLASFVKSEIEKWAGPIKASGVSMN